MSVKPGQVQSASNAVSDEAGGSVQIVVWADWLLLDQVSPATLDEHESDALHEDRVAGILGPWTGHSG